MPNFPCLEYKLKKKIFKFPFVQNSLTYNKTKDINFAT